MTRAQERRTRRQAARRHSISWLTVGITTRCAATFTAIAANTYGNTQLSPQGENREFSGTRPEPLERQDLSYDQVTRTSSGVHQRVQPAYHLLHEVVRSGGPRRQPDADRPGRQPPAGDQLLLPVHRP